MQIEVIVWIGLEMESENEFCLLDERIDEFYFKVIRIFFIGNFEKIIIYYDFCNIF